jgi:hypothetical protein
MKQMRSLFVRAWMKNLSKGGNCGSLLQPIVLDPEEIASAAARRWGWQDIGKKI